MAMLALLDLSTGHLTQATRDWLDEEMKIEAEEKPGRPVRGWMTTPARSGVVCFPYDYGWFLHVREEAGPGDPLASDLQGVISYASREGFDWIKFDADGERYEQLPFYE